jgi:hypothetical protein
MVFGIFCKFTNFLKGVGVPKTKNIKIKAAKVLKNEKIYVIIKPDITQKWNVKIKLNPYRSNPIFEI